MTPIKNGIERFQSMPFSMKILIFNTFAVAFGSFMITPFMAVLLKNGIGLETSQTSALVAAATFIQFGGGAIGGLFGERFGLKRTMVGALCARVIGLVLLAFATRIPLLVIPAILLVAAAPAFYLPSNRGYIVQTVSPEQRPLFVSLSNAALNGGMAAGPLIAALFIDSNLVALSLAVAVLFSVLALSHQLTLEPIHISISQQPAVRVLAGAIRRTWKTIAVNTAIYYVYFFYQNFMGLYTAKLSGLRVFSYCLLLNFALMFFLQPLFASRIAQADYRRLLALGFVLMGMGFACIAGGSIGLLFIGTAIMTIGQLALFLRADLEMVGRLAETPATAFGLQRLATGLGGLLCGLTGGPVFSYVEKTGNLPWFWLSVAIQSLAFAIIVCLVGKERPFRTVGRVTTESQVKTC